MRHGETWELRRKGKGEREKGQDKRKKILGMRDKEN